MQKISAWTDLVAPLDRFRYGSLVGGVPPTPLKAEWLNMVQEELANFILAYLPALDKADNTQLLQAIRAFGEAFPLKATTLAGYGIVDAYTKPQADGLLAQKANNAITLGGYGIGDAYTKTQTDGLLEPKADKATSLAGYGITDPVWTDLNATPKAIIAQASAEAGAVGTYALLMIGGSEVSSYLPLPAGTLVAGSQCLFTNCGGSSSSGVPAGTWKLMGALYNYDAINPDSATLCLRVS